MFFYLNSSNADVFSGFTNLTTVVPGSEAHITFHQHHPSAHPHLSNPLTTLTTNVPLISPQKRSLSCADLHLPSDDLGGPPAKRLSAAYLWIKQTFDLCPPPQSLCIIDLGVLLSMYTFLFGESWLPCWVRLTLGAFLVWKPPLPTQCMTRFAASYYFGTSWVSVF